MEDGSDEDDKPAYYTGEVNPYLMRKELNGEAEEVEGLPVEPEYGEQGEILSGENERILAPDVERLKKKFNKQQMR